MVIGEVDAWLVVFVDFNWSLDKLAWDSLDDVE